MTAPSLDTGYFDRLYAADADPWRFETSAYEQAKYADTIAALPRQRYTHGVEIGCSIGVLTEQLAARCDQLLGVDVAAAALATARRRCARLDHVDFALLALPSQRRDGQFDLIMLSEVLYYFDPPTIAAVADAVIAMAAPGADIVLVHWLGPTPDYPMTGDAAVAAFLAAIGPRADLMKQHRHADYRFDCLRCAEALSPAGD